MSNDSTGQPDKAETRPWATNLPDDQIAALADEFKNTDFRLDLIRKFEATRRLKPQSGEIEVASESRAGDAR